MSPLDAVRRLADSGIGLHCDFCTGSPISGHFEGCPILGMPKIVAALEAAERWCAAETAVKEEQARADMPEYIPSLLFYERVKATIALVAALKGESA